MPDPKDKHGDHEKEKPKHDPAELHRKASEHLRQAADHNDSAAKYLADSQPDQAAGCALKAHAHQIEATHHLNEAIKHQSGLKKKDEPKKPDPIENLATASR